VRLPTWLYRLYKELCREAWRGLHEHEGIGLLPRLAAVKQSDLYQLARERDASFQVEAGPIVHGHTEFAGRNNLNLFNNDALMGGPS